MDMAHSLLQALPWDSDFLGFRVARLTATGLSWSAFDGALQEATQAGYRLLYVEVDPADETAAGAARQNGAQLVDRKVTFVLSLPAPGPAPMPGIDQATEFTPRLEALAWQSGEYSRFRLDSRFEPRVFQDLYTRWMRNSLSHELARQVLVFRDPAGSELGVLTLGEKNGRADIGLLAVDASVRGQRVGQGLVRAAVVQAQQWGHSELQVVTQLDNEPACRFYEKCGFRLSHELHIYHVWVA